MTLIHRLFEGQAAREPDRIALVFAPEPGAPRIELTYGELNRRAGRLAAHLRGLGVGPEQRVGVSLDRSPEMIVALLAILKAGGAYVPLDPAYPKDRLSLMMEDAFAGLASPVLVTRDELLPRLPPIQDGVAVVCVGKGFADGADGADGEDGQGGEELSANLAYLIFTSGSTGRPKAVAIEHRSAVEMIRWARGVYTPEELAGVFASTSINFDLSVFEMFVPLASGGTIILGENALALARTPAAGEVTLINTVPSAMAELLHMGAVPPSARTVNLAGEPLRGALARRIHETGRVERLWNLYGPSEDTTYSTFAEVPPGDGEPTIGRPLPGTRAYVLDTGLDRAPEGDAGELFLAGPGLARGYLNRPDLTAERFVPDPFAEEGGQRMYRTGDLVRWLPEGDLKYIGRADHQVKIRGYRIEIGEIEAALASCPGVRDAAVLAREERLVAYVVASDPTAKAGEILDFLRRKLPDPMLPSAFVFLGEMPLNPNGKVDRGALMRIAPSGSRGALEAPRTPVETVLADIWAEALGLDRVGVSDDFLESGGHSLLASRILSRVREIFGVDLPPGALFEAPTVAALALRVESRDGADPLPPILPLSGQSRELSLPLSFAQERLWFLDRLIPNRAVYNMPYTVRLRGELNRTGLKRALSEIVRRHEALRTVFQAGAAGARQIVQPPGPVPLPLVDMEALAADTLLEGARRPFDLTQDLLLRTELFQLAEHDHVLLLVMHHIASDGWSVEILARELAALYAGSPLPDLPVQYADFAVWQREWLRGEVLEEQLSWWRAALEGAPSLVDLPLDRPRPAVQTFQGARRGLTLQPEIAAGLRSLHREAGATLFMALLAVFQGLIHRYTGQSDLLVGAPIANRPRRETENLIGFFVNTLPLRGQVGEDSSLNTLLRQARSAALGAYNHQDLPFDVLIDELRIERTLGANPLVQVVLAIQDPLETFSLPELAMSFEELHAGTAPFDLFLALAEEAEGLAGFLEYSTDLFDASTAERWARHFLSLLAAAVAEPDRPVAELPLLDDAERHQLLVEWNDTRPEPSREIPVHLLFEEWAERTPDALAVVGESATWTYGELNRHASRLASRLRSLGVGAESRVAVAMEHSPERIAVLLAVLKAGGVYVSLDPADPPDRREFVLADCGAALLVTGEELLPLEEGADSDVPDLDRVAYVIYTSGSTGRPKGVEVPHRGLLNLVRWHQRAYAVTPADRATQLAGAGFDASVWELWPYLTAGAAVLIVPQEVRAHPARLVEWMTGQRVTLSFLPTALAEMALEEPWPKSSLRALLVGGDRLHHAPSPGLGFELVNHYGPTESSVVSTATAVWPDGTGAPPIGRPIDGIRAFLLDRAGSPVPIGVAGELHVGGSGLARAYLGRPDLTAERFVPDQMTGEPGSRLYRTGDLARQLPSGQIEFLGRIDNQVKVRGFRIELGEIEAVLRRHPEVREAVVTARPSGAGDLRLVAYVVARAGLATRDLAEHLRAELPAFMVPSAFVLLDALPLNASGKVDRRALSGPLAAEPSSEGSDEPRTPTEVLLAGIWCDLLGLDEVSREADFFELGGHSLLATRLISRIAAELEVDLPLRAVFSAPTVAGLALRLDTALEQGEGLQAAPIRPVPREGPLPLSFAQERLWLFERLMPGSAAYEIPISFRLEGRLGPAVLAASLNEIARRHEVLRTLFASAAGQPYQVVQPFRPVQLPVVDLQALPPRSREAEVGRWTSAGKLGAFDLESGPLLRAMLLELGQDSHVLSLNMHHIVTDGWSMGVLTRELGALYSAFSEGRPSPLPELPIQYADFAVWQRRFLGDGALDRQLAWWQQELDGAPPQLVLPYDRPRPRVQSFRAAQRISRIPEEPARRLRALSRKNGSTLFMTLMAAFQVLLYRYTGQEDLLVGTPIANRNRSEIEGLIGFFVNTLVLRGRPSAELGFRDLLRQVRSTALAAYAHQDLPFERLVEELRVERNLGHNPLFQVLFALQSTASGELELPGIAAVPLKPDAIATPFDVGLNVWDQGGDLAVEIEYSTDLFDAATIDRLLGHFRVVLEGITGDQDRTLAELPLLTEAEHRQLAEWNDTRLDAPSLPVLPIPRAFEEQARRAPGAVAIELQGESLTYGELDLRADRLAARLRARGVERETRVGLMMERSLDLAVGLLGIWKAGGAYVPLDPHLPEERLAFQIEDALLGQAAAVLVARERPQGRLADLPLDVVQPDGGDETVLERLEILPGDLAYLIYTSGTTGRPKAVLVEHGNLSRTMQAAQAAFGFEPPDRMPCLAAFTFDIFLFELLGPLLAGGTAVLYPLKPTLDVGRLVEDLPGLTRLHGVPALMRQVVEMVRGRSLRTGLKQVFVGGDAVPADLLGEMREAFPEARITILYGPTEAAIICSRHEVTGEDDELGGRAFLGRPLANVHLDLRDGSGELVPIGVPGEVWIGGPGVARGYLHLPDLTQERFTFAGGERCYRTGDLARRLPDGTLEFLGRMDQQVKVRGFRIELGEIEAVLAQHPSVRQAAVLALREGGETRLVAYVVRGIDDLRPYLASRLPDYMIPSSLVLLDELPLTPHGKVDRTALARIAPTTAATGTTARSAADSAPRTLTEELLAGAWSGLLGRERVGIHDNFFEIGGHSLLVTRLAFWISTELGVDLPVRAIFEAPTLAALAERIEEERAAGVEPAPPIRRVPRDGQDLPLSFAQERLWILDRLNPGLAVYNVPLALRLSGAVDPDVLASALDEVVRRHEALRTTFEESGGRPRQVVLPFRPLERHLVDFRGDKAEAGRWMADEASRPFDLSSEPLIRVALLRLGRLEEDEEWVLFVNIHHIVSDGWSMEVLSRELAALYQAFSQGLPSPLPELPVQYADFVLWQREWLSGQVLQRQIAWWKEQLLGVPEVLELPFDRPRRAVQTYRGSVRLPRWSPALADAVRLLSRRSGTTLSMTLTAAFQALLHRLSGQADLAVGSPIANRTHRDLEELIGFFVNTVVLRARFESGSGEGISFRELLGQVRTMSLGAQAHQDLPFERLVEELRTQRSLHYNPLFQVMFAFQSARPEALDIPGVAVEKLDLEVRATPFDLGVSIWERGGALAGEVEYSTDLFDGTTIDRMMEQLRVLLEGAVADPGRPVAGLPLLSEAELHQLREWNDARLEARLEGRLEGRFEGMDLRDRSGELVPIGVPGEIWIGGSRTGDLARRLPDGTLELLGRVDQQVKVRGFRIELGEIEAVLAQHPDVRQVAVLALKGEGEDRLVAYVVGEDHDLRSHLGSRLPDYMVPSALVVLDELPLTPHGKVDRKALARIVPAAPVSEAHTAPRTPTEELLAGVWSGLLGLERVGIHDNFFEIGGHSLLATRLAFWISKELGVDLPMRAIFEAPTVAVLARRVEEGRAAGLEQAPPIRRVPRDAFDGGLPLSFAQERLWFLDRLEPDRAFYNMPFALRLKGELDVASLETAIGEIVYRHEVLRTTFKEAGGMPRQVVSDTWPGLPILDLEGLPAELREPEAERRLMEAGLLPFDLERGPLLRAFLLRLSGREHALLMALHHIVGDGWSFEVLRGELAALYRGQAGQTLPELPIQYADYAVWQREWLRGEILEREIAWWKKDLEGAPTVLSLPTDRLRPAFQTFHGTILRQELPPGLMDAARDVSRRHGTTLFMTFLAVFQLLLHRLSAQDEVLVGTPVAGRSRQELQGLIGFFVNTVVLRGRFGEPGASFERVLEQTRTSTLETYAHQDLPFEKLVEEMKVERSLSHNPLFQVMFSLQSDPVVSELQGLESDWLPLPIHSTKVDLALAVDERSVAVEYATDLFDRTTIERMLRHFRALLEGAVSDAALPLSGLSLLSEAERHQILEWNDTRPEQPASLPVHLLFEEQARRTPGAAAVVFEDESLTYRELSRRSDLLAARLRGMGVGKGTRVGLMVERSAGMVAALLGIWKAGGAYVPLDPNQPEARLSLLIEDAIQGQSAQVVVDQEFLADESRVEDAPGESGEPVSLRDLAYLIYTSGTTGRPKAVMVEHGNLAQTLRAAQEAFAFEPSDRMACLAAFTFDIFLLELLGPLLAGGTAVLFPLGPTLDVPRLVESLDELTLLHAVPAVMREVVEGARIKGTGRRLRQLFVGGDAVPADLLSDMRSVFPAARIHVLYGPTETAIICSSHEVGEEPSSRLGRPLSGAVLELRDRHGHLVPIGVPGEVWIGGEGVTRGYLHQPDLTAEKFVTSKGQRWYRSGDLARRLADGTLEFLGRIDHQVKVRGFRIELGEIESVLAQHPGVVEAAVLAVGEAHGKRLAAFVSLEGEAAADTETLRRYLAARLPDYMVPSSLTVLDALPLTPHGKVDRRALERRAPASAREAEEWVAPATPTEVALAAIWSEVLGVERVGLRDGFFELGGHSLMATRLVSRVGTALAVELPLRTVFEAPVLEAMAGRIDALRAAGAGLQVPPIVPVRREGDLPLSFAQERLWFLYQLEPESPLYNIMAALRLAGSLDVGALRASLNEIVRRHEVLRTTYAHEGRGVQRIAPPTEILLSVADLRGLPEKARDPESLRLVKQEELRPFDLRQGPVARFRLLRLDENRWILLLAIHHIASDGWSTGVLMQELMELYEGRILPELPVQYGDFAVWQRGLEGEILERLLAWWRQALAGAPARIDLPLDRPRPAAQRYRGATRPLNVPLELFQKADDLSRKLGTTLFMTLFACFQVLLHRVTGQDDLLVGTPVAGRNRGETESLIGCFVNTLVLRGRLEPGERDEITFRDLLGRVRAMALDAFMHQDLPFEKLVEDLQVERSLSYNPLFQVLFTLQNAPMDDPRLPGVDISPVEGDSDVSLFDLSLGLGEFRGEVLGGLQYNVDLFDAETVDRWAEHFRLLLEGVVENPDQRLRDLPGLAEPERRQQADEGPVSEEALQARVAARGDEVAERRSALSEQKKAALEKLLRARRKQS